MKRDLGDHLLDDGATEGIEVLRHQDECARAADHIVLVVFLEPAGRIGVFGVPRHRPVAEDDEAVDHDPFGDRLVTGELDVAAGIVGAVSRDIDGTARTFERRTLQLGARELDAAADRGAVGKGAGLFE
jgi:hypothetical protein